MQVKYPRLFGVALFLTVFTVMNVLPLPANASPIINLINVVPNLRLWKKAPSTLEQPLSGSDYSENATPVKQQTLEGKITNTKVLSRESLGRIGHVAGDIKKTSLVLMYTVTQKEVVVRHAPNVVLYTDAGCAPPTDVSGMISLRELEPSRSILHRATTFVVTYACKLENEIATTTVPENLSEETKHKWDEVRRLSGQMHTDIATLVNSVVAGDHSKYNQLRLKKSVLGAYDKSDVIAQLCQQMISDLKRVRLG